MSNCKFPSHSEPPKKSKIWNFAAGGLSGMFATCCIQPIDMIKVRIQLRSEAGSKELSPFKVASDIYKNEGGVRQFYKGQVSMIGRIDSALLRQAVYTTLRLGIFFSLNDMIKQRKGSDKLSTLEKIACSFTAGGIGSFCGNPFDLCLVRLQSDLTLPPQQRRNYKNVFDALVRIPREEGITGLWKGAVPTVTRAISLNIGMLVSYEEAKERIAKLLGPGRITLLLASAVSGIFTALFSLPFDNVKTKLQKQKALPDGKLPYSGFANCFKITFQREGITGLYSGLPTYYFRVAPHAMITLLASEFLKKQFGLL